LTGRTVLFRADGSYHIGIGHIMRCIAIAQSFEKAGISSVFICKGYEQGIIELIQKNGYAVETISKSSDFTEDASLTLESASRYRANLIMIDMSNVDTLADLDGFRRYLQVLKSNKKFLVTIDGLDKDCANASIPIQSDIIIIPYFGAGERRYIPCNNADYLLGPSYFIFRQEFMKAAKAERKISKEAKKILVTMGGSDPLNLTMKIARALLKLSRGQLNLRIVIGPGFNRSIRQDLEKALKDSNGNYELVAGNPDMAELMLWSDLAITSSGLTKYETALMGTPSIIISYDDFQEEIMREFEKYGSALHLGQAKNIREGDIVKTVDSLLDDAGLRGQMSKKGRDLVDGKGVKRIVSKISEKVRP